MNVIKNKKADVGAATGMTLGEIIGWIIIAALIVFAFFWYSGLGSKMRVALKSYF